MDITPYIGTIVTVIIAVGGVYAAIASRLTRLETMIEQLTKSVDKHNTVVERMTTAEADIRNLYHRYDDLKNEDDRR